jgi:tRNA modification GTPase
VHLDLGGYPVILADTAGLRALDEAAGPQAAIEQAGMARARARAAQADVKLLLVDAEAALGDEAALSAALELFDDRSVLLLNKSDRCDSGRLRDLREHLGERLGGQNSLAISARTGEGLDQVLVRLVAFAGTCFGDAEGAAGITRLRHRSALEDCRDALERAETAGLAELVAEELRLALRALGRVTGRVDVDDLLDVVFREFCIGK